MTSTARRDCGSGSITLADITEPGTAGLPLGALSDEQISALAEGLADADTTAQARQVIADLKEEIS